MSIFAGENNPGDGDAGGVTPELHVEDNHVAVRFASRSPSPEVEAPSSTLVLHDDSAFRPVAVPSSPASAVQVASPKEERRLRKRKAAENGDLSGCGNCEPARCWKQLKPDDEHDPYQCPVCLRTTANSPAVVSCRCANFQRYHIGCFANNMQSTKSCPLCRASLTQCWIVGFVQILENSAIKDYCVQKNMSEYRRWSSFLKILYKSRMNRELTVDVKDSAFCGVYRIPQLVQTILTQFMMVTFTVEEFVSAYDKFVSSIKRDVSKMEDKLKMTKYFLQNECSL